MLTCQYNYLNKFAATESSCKTTESVLAQGNRLNDYYETIVKACEKRSVHSTIFNTLPMMYSLIVKVAVVALHDTQNCPLPHVRFNRYFIWF